jgi:hypothetical protein
MRIVSFTLLVVSLALAGDGPRPAQAAPESLDLKGSWKLVVYAIGDNDLLIFDVKSDGGKLAATVKDSLQEVLPQAEITKIEQKGNTVTVVVKSQAGESTFSGTLATNGPNDGHVMGSFRLRETLFFPAQLVKTDAAKVAPLTPSPITQQVGMAMREPNPKARADKLKAILHESRGNPITYAIYKFMMSSASDAGLTAQDARALLDQWLAEAKPYGVEWINDQKLNALRALAGQKSFAEMTLNLAVETEKELGAAAPTEVRAEVARTIVDSANALGKADIAKAAEGRLNKLELQLDEEYLKAVPPFQPVVFAGRNEAKGDRVVLLELFTGAECPPCVAADVAFDALLKTYKPTDLVTLQYHLHIPGPDPLTNADSIARSDYYEVGGTPSPYFNGKPVVPGGGLMMHAKSKYDEYRQSIDSSFESKKLASIDLAAKRSGNEIHIKATAQASSPSEAKPKTAKGKAGDVSEGSKPRLRLALVEEAIHYVGGNKLRFHHHVVRALPGGAEGVALEGGKATAEQIVKLDDLRKSLDSYLSEFSNTLQTRGAKFPKALPPIDLKSLSVVAFVQDDSDKTVWHAVMVPVEDAK